MRSENVFSPGPSHLPTPVLNKVLEYIACYPGSNVSILELGHRTQLFMGIIEAAKFDLRDLLNIPQDFQIVFVSGGASLEFQMVPLNIDQSIGYIVSGRWSYLAYNEAKRVKDNVILCNTIPQNDSYHDFSLDWCDFSGCDYVYYVSNETAHGVQIHNNELSKITSQRNLICDMSSDIATHNIDWDKHAIVFAGTAKNLGISGMNVLIVHDSILAQTQAEASITNFKTLVEANSVYNTPATLQLAVVDMMLQWYKELGGLPHFIQLSQAKARLVYDLLQKYPNIFRIYPTNPEYYSNVNIVFHFVDDTFTAKFIEFASHMDIHEIKGHAVLGGIRLSMYNSISYSQAELFVRCLQDFLSQEKLI